MINKGLTISIEDEKKLKKLKNSSAYGVYLESIANSPIYVSLMNEHISNVDVSKDIQYLKKTGLIGSKTSPKSINTLLIKAVSRLAINLLADSIILKELEDNKIEDIADDIKKDFQVKYIIGDAPRKYYIKAKSAYDNGKLNKNSLAYKGLINYIKKEPNDELFDYGTEIESQKETKKDGTCDTSNIDLNSDSIQL